MAFYHRRFLPEIPASDDCLKSNSCRDNFPHPPPKHDMPPPFIVIIGLLGVSVLIICYVVIRRCLSGRRRNIPRLENEIFQEDFIDEHQEHFVIHPIWYIRTIGLPQSVIDSIQVFKYKKGEGLIDGGDCSVCLSEFEEDNSVRLLPKCSHAFHVACIDTWLRSHMNCPVCRAPVLNSNNASQVSSGETSSDNNSELTHEENEEESSEVETDETGDEISIALSVEDEKLAEVSTKEMGRSERIRVRSDLADHRAKVEQELEPVRRSVSLDLTSASTIYKAVANVNVKKDEGPWNVSSLKEHSTN